MADEKTFFAQFTTRQHEVLVCLLAGDSNVEIAARLELSISSVKRYVAQLRRALGAESRAEVEGSWQPVSQRAAA